MKYIRTHVSKPLSVVLCSVVALEHDHEVAMRGALSALRSDTDQRTKEAMQVAREEEKGAALREKEAALEELRQQHLAAMQMEEKKVNDLRQKWEKAEKVGNCHMCHCLWDTGK